MRAKTTIKNNQKMSFNRARSMLPRVMALARRAPSSCNVSTPASRRALSLFSVSPFVANSSLKKRVSEDPFQDWVRDVERMTGDVFRMPSECVRVSAAPVDS